MVYDVVIIGAGPAGLTASIYARRAEKKVLVLEESNYGGQIINTVDIENYPANYHISGFDFANNLYSQAVDLKAEIKFEKVLEIKNKKIKEIITNKKKYFGKTIIIATGSTYRLLGIKNEKDFVGRGISYCATCDGNFYKNKDVCVVGGGNTAINEALYLSDIVRKVYLVHRREELRADLKDINLLKNKNNVEFILNSSITKLNGKDILESIDILDKDNNIKNIKVSGLFVAIGHVPLNECFKDLIKIDNNGYVLSKENCHTNIKGIFVAGDIRHKELRQLVTAVSDGAIAAYEAVKYLKNK